MLPVFGLLLARALEKAGISQRAFAKRVGLTQPYVSLLIAGKRAVPHKGVEDWPAILGLGKDEADEFLLAADLTSAKPRVRRWIASLLRQTAS